MTLENQIDQPAVQDLLRPERLAAFLAASLPAPDGEQPLGAFRVRGGHSNETFFIWRGAGRWVLRRPPAGHYLPTAHDVAREYRVLSALVGTAVPVPRPVLLCEDASVIGAPFYLMEALDGVVLYRHSPPWAADPAVRHAIGLELVDALTVLHKVDWRAVGLESFGKLEGYLERQLRRWQGQLAGAHTRDIPDLDAVTAWLVAHLPASPPTTIVHGDFRLDNAMYADGLPVRIVGLLDWEMATLGDPLADLGYLLAFWREAGDPPMALAVESDWRVTEEPGFPTREELIARYAEQTGLEIAPEKMRFYRALAVWKMAILLEGSYARFLHGTTDDPLFPELRSGVPALAAWALQIVHGEA
jgi:aminoglycoside phosphotransferase (APT) family kinase protein